MANSMKKYELLLVGGGTGGHAAPILAIYEHLSNNPKLNISVVGVGSVEERVFLGKIPEYRVVCSGKIHREFTIKNVLELLKLACGLVQSVLLLTVKRPDMVFSKGGYASLPIVLTSKFLRIPYFFHESDIEMGKTNRIVAGGAGKIFVTYPLEKYKGMPKERMVFSGPILRESFYKKVLPDRKDFGFKNDKPVILVTGGSQGSLLLSEKTIDAAKKLLCNFNIIHQAGKHSIEIATKFRDSLDSKLKSSYYACEFLKNDSGKDLMVSAINLADLVVARAGITIVEMAILGKVMILVPWKYSAQDHQLKNAKYFVSAKSAKMITDDDLSAETLVDQIDYLFKNKNLINELSENAKKLFPASGTELVCSEILKMLEEI